MRILSSAALAIAAAACTTTTTTTSPSGAADGSAGGEVAAPAESASPGAASPDGGVAGVGATDPPDPASLFAAPTGDATPSVLYGSWIHETTGGAGSKGSASELRLWIGAAKVMLAHRCTIGSTSGVVSALVAARIEPSGITLLESKQDEKIVSDAQGSENCSVALDAGAGPYSLSGLTLVTDGPGSLMGTWTKRSD